MELGMNHDTAWFARQLAHCDAVLAHLERQHTQDEIERAIESARRDAEQITGRREPEQQTLTLAA
jgi:hypothetical protein